MRAKFHKKNGKIYLTVEPNEHDIDSKIILADFARQISGKKTKTEFASTHSNLDKADECLKVIISAADEDNS